MTRCPNSVFELLQEPEVVFVKEADILDLVLENRNPFDADPPREAGVALGVVADRLENSRVHHAAAANLDPACPLAHRASIPLAPPAAQVDFGARLRVGKEAGSKA